ncbi:hypothetical protein [Comamonas flocculans]|uniref:Uncharacterized protein n=1 Tax=Comamonas flocculans TaxID=2597701 RepID=A0A5B8RUB6_9BURK|nr:hypothetical protein [Comamonas flocculans]QEA13209.1 hypothetical protein FOZ74_09305 [Comamonas flocculans]
MKRPLPRTAQQQQLIDRITAQRARWRQRRQDRRDHRAGNAGLRAVAAGAQTSEPLLARVSGFAHQHPLVMAGALAALAVAGPRRLARWASVVLPLVLQLRR